MLIGPKFRKHVHAYTLYIIQMITYIDIIILHLKMNKHIVHICYEYLFIFITWAGSIVLYASCDNRKLLTLVYIYIYIYILYVAILDLECITCDMQSLNVHDARQMPVYEVLCLTISTAVYVLCLYLLGFLHKIIYIICINHIYLYIIHF